MPLIRPLYLAYDVSCGSDQLQETLAILSRLEMHVRAETDFRFGVFAFSQTAVTLKRHAGFGLGSHAVSMPPLARVADYESFFHLAHATIEDDLRVLRASRDHAFSEQESVKLLRPVLFIIASTDPASDDWTSSFDTLTAERWCPTIVAIGVGNVRPRALRRMATVIAVKATKHALVGEVVVDFVLDHYRTRSSNDDSLHLQLFDMEVVWSAKR